MRYVFEYVPELGGWKMIYTAQSFEHACKVCQEKESENPDKKFCVNNWQEPSFIPLT